MNNDMCSVADCERLCFAYRPFLIALSLNAPYPRVESLIYSRSEGTFFTVTKGTCFIRECRVLSMDGVHVKVYRHSST